ncbi:MAG: trehalase family glycosidase [Oscillospiraceae bacterium]
MRHNRLRKNDLRGNYQWDYPNAWACLQMVAAAGLINYGFTDDAVRLAVKFTSMVESCYQKTGNLWEKYNAEDGGINTVNEYEMPPMLGWTAGTYLYLIEICKKYLNGGTGNE